MIFGKDTTYKLKKRKAALSKKMDKMIPQDVFLLWPRQLENEQWIWLQKAWRVAIFEESLEYTFDYSYFLNREDALKHSRYMNLQIPRQYSSLVDYAKERIGY